MQLPSSTAPDRVRALARAALVPRFAVPAVFVVVAAWLAWQTVHVDSFVWLIDEMLYVKYALGYAHLDGLLPTVHGTRYGPPNVLYALLLAPAWGLFPAVTAFHVAHVINAIAFASTIFPVYLLARRLGARWGWALAGGALAIVVPWCVTSALLLTEALAYPMFAWAVLAMVVAISQPTPRHDVLVGVAILAATLVRTQLVLLAAVLVLAIVVDELARREPRTWRERLYPHRALYGLIVGGGIVLALLQLAGADLLSSYVNATNKSPLPPGWLESTLVHTSRVVVGLGIVPAILFVAWLLRVGAHPREGVERAGALVLGFSALAVCYVGGYFAQNIAGGIVQERYVIYVVPLLAVGAVVMASDRERPAPRLSLVAATLLVAIATLVETYAPGRIDGAFGQVMSPVAAYGDELGPTLSKIGRTFLGNGVNPSNGLIFVFAVLLVLLLVAFADRVRRYALPVVFALLLVFGVVQARWLMPKVINGITQAYPAQLPGVAEQPRDWVDRALPDGADAAVLAGRLNSSDESSHWLWIEFWNKRIRQGVSSDGLSAYSGWPAVKYEIDARSGRMTAPGAPRHLVVSEHSPALQLEGETVARAAPGAVLLRTAEPLQARTWLEGTDINGKPNSAQPLRLHVYGAAADRPVELTLLASAPAANTAPQPLRYTVRGDGKAKRGRIDAGAVLKVVATPRDGVIRIDHERIEGAADATPLDIAVTSVRTR